jgi:ribonucleotide monophosphatase NagD (HAD superfamily)
LWGNRYVWLTVTVVLGIQISFTYLPLMQRLFGTRLGTVRDRLSTDIAMAHRAGVLGVLVLTGEATASDAGKTQNPPDLVVPGLMEFGAPLRGAKEGGR